VTTGTNTPEEKAGFIADVLFSNSSSAAAGHKPCHESRLWRMSSMNKNVPANLAAAVAALCAGTSVVVTRLAVGEIDPIALAFYRYVVAAVCLVPLLPFVWPNVRLLVADIVKIALLGAVFFGFFP
jgi:drug/metabolite transporter (DMT)-like permease